ncbi:YidB family protein [Streptomyces sp. NPDC001774]
MRRILRIVEDQPGGFEHPLDELVEVLDEGGLADEADSWVSLRPNLPVTADQLADALPAQLLRALAGAEGTTPSAAAARLARDLPAAIDAFCPHGYVPLWRDLVCALHSDAGELVQEADAVK